MSGYTTLSPKSLLKKNILSIILIGTNPRTGIVHLINFDILLELSDITGEFVDERAWEDI